MEGEGGGGDAGVNFFARRHFCAAAAAARARGGRAQPGLPGAARGASGPSPPPTPARGGRLTPDAPTWPGRESGDPQRPVGCARLAPSPWPGPHGSRRSHRDRGRAGMAPPAVPLRLRPAAPHKEPGPGLPLKAAAGDLRCPRVLHSALRQPPRRVLPRGRLAPSSTSPRPPHCLFPGLRDLGGGRYRAAAAPSPAPTYPGSATRLAPSFEKT